MKTLLIDNGSTLIEKLSLLSPGEETVVSYDEIPQDISPFSLILLSGSSKLPVYGNEDVFATEIDLIRNTKVPMIGICLGHELIAHAFNSPLTHLKSQHVGMTEIEVVSEHEMFGNKKSFTVYENHQYGVTEVNHELEVLAKTNHAIAVLKHHVRPIYGFQFHPEHHADKQYGDEVYLKLFQRLVRE